MSEPPSNPADPAVESENRSTDATDVGATVLPSTYKVLGDLSAVDGTGVVGRNTAQSGLNYGVEGITQSRNNDAAGIRAEGWENGLIAETTADFDRTRGVYGLVNGGTNSEGVRGEAGDSAGDQSVGVYGRSSADDGRGVYGYVDGTADTFKPAALFGVALNGWGLYSADDAYVRTGLAINTDDAAPRTLLDVQGSPTGSGEEITSHVASIENTATADGGDGLAITLNATSPGGTENFVTFLGPEGGVGAIEGDGGGGVTLKTSGSDFAEYLPTADPDAEFDPGTVVGLEGGELVAGALEADLALVVSTRPMVLGNADGDDDPDGHAPVALVGQVPVDVDGPVAPGEVLVAAGDGLATVRDPNRERDRDPDADRASQPIVGRALDACVDRDGGTVTALVGQDGRVAAGAVASLRGRNDDLATTVDRLRDEVAALEARVARAESDGDEPNPDRITSVEKANERLQTENEELRERLAAVETHLGLGNSSAERTAPGDD